jgi:hypothetical protein
LRLLVRLVIILFLLFSFSACSINKSSLSSFGNKSKNVEAQKRTQTDENDLVLEAYKTVIQNKQVFMSTDEGKKVLFNDFLTNGEVFDTIFSVIQFTVIDLDGDKIPELVLGLAIGENTFPEFYEILHYTDGAVYGYIKGNREFNNLKTDGTFLFSGGASYNGYRKLIFKSNTCETEELGYFEAEDDGTILYYINNNSVTEESYNSFTNEEDGKSDVIWHEFNQEKVVYFMQQGNSK